MLANVRSWLGICAMQVWLQMLCHGFDESWLSFSPGWTRGSQHWSVVCTTALDHFRRFKDVFETIVVLNMLGTVIAITNETIRPNRSISGDHRLGRLSLIWNSEKIWFICYQRCNRTNSLNSVVRCALLHDGDNDQRKRGEFKRSYIRK